jgi:hypothetical protein
MNSQDFRSLQEAYLDVYPELDEAIDDEDAPSRQKSHNPDFYGSKLQRMMRKRNPGGGPKMDKSKRNFEKYKKSGKSPSWWEKTNEEVDIYDIILSHLLDEGYAETPEAAEAIIVNMSEDWRDSIIG